LSCIRSSPADRRYLTTTLAAATSKTTTLEIQTTSPSQPFDGPARPGMPVGLGRSGNPAVTIGPGESQSISRESASSTATVQKTRHHRRVSGRPSGNSSSRNASTPAGNRSVSDQFTNHAAQTAAAWDGPASAYSAYSPASPRAASTRPMPSRNQPMGLTGLRAATTAPTSAKATMNRSGLKAAEISSRSRLRAASSHATANPATLTTPASQGSADQTRRRPARSRPAAALTIGCP